MIGNVSIRLSSSELFVYAKGYSEKVRVSVQAMDSQGRHR